LRRLIKNRKATAEVIGSIMFIVILLFFFTNVYLWHDAAVKQMNDLYVNKMNAGMEVKFDPASESTRFSCFVI
jgi:predicted transporter